jgi:hypothetical protein
MQLHSHLQVGDGALVASECGDVLLRFQVPHANQMVLCAGGYGVRMNEVRKTEMQEKVKQNEAK